jgi:CheY-like chemotaxis protein
MVSAAETGDWLPAKRVFVVEDEVMIRMLLEDMLTELGCTIAAAAARLDEAVELAKTAAFDVAILDVNLNGQPILPVADLLASRGMPFVFATGYGEHGLPDAHRERPMLKKPFQLESLRRTLETALNG